MKQLYLLSTILLAASGAMAQPVINKLFDYSPGMTYTYKKLQPGSVIDTSTIPTVGTNLTWNMNSLQFDAATYTDSIISHAASKYPASFTGCTYVFKEYIGLEQYYRKDGNTIYYMGNSYSPIPYTPNPPVVVYPGTYSTTPNNVYGPMTTTVSGSGTWTYYGRYNAYGTLQIGGNTFNNVALYITHGGMPSQSYTDYMWIRENEVNPLLRIQFQHLSGTTTVNLGYGTTQALGVDRVSNELQTQLSPNPCTDALYITAAEELVSAAVYDISGKLMLHTRPMSNHTTINTSDLSNGMYFLKFTAKSGTVDTRKFIKEQ